jgi:hypothetical protein
MCVEINVVIVFTWNILENFTSIECDRIVFLIRAAIRLKNLIFSLFRFEVIIELYRNGHIFAIRLPLHCH